MDSPDRSAATTEREEQARVYESLRDSSPPGGPAWRMWNEKAKAARG